MIFTEEDVNWVFSRMDGRCFYCGMRLSRENFGFIAERGAWDIGNFIPLSRDGALQRDNWVPSCIICETVKGEQFPWEFDARRFRQKDQCPSNYMSGGPYGNDYLFDTRQNV